MRIGKFVVIMAIFFAATPAMAQFGIQGGGAFGSLKVSEEGESETFGTRTGFTFGGFYRMPLGQSLAFQPELNWIQKGGKEKIDFLGEEISTSVILNYIEVPLYFLYTGGNTSGFYGGIGPSFNFGMSGKLKAEYDGESEEEDIKFGEDYKGFHVGINAQAGYSLPSGLLFNAFVSQSITNSAPEEEGDDVKANMFTFGVRVGFMLGGGEASRKAKVKLKQVL
jgi:hypothetical protein